MSIRIVCWADGECEVSRDGVASRIRTGRPAAYGGAGNAFSATDLLAAALGVCIATDIAPLAERHGVAASAITMEVTKELQLAPKALVGITVRVAVPRASPELLTMMTRAAQHCIVRKSLHDNVRVHFVFTADQPGLLDANLDDAG